MIAVPKYIPYRNDAILRFAEGQRCTHCDTSDGSTIPAHSNAIEHGKGVGKKADACYVAYLCFKCHDAYDRKLVYRWEDHNGKQQTKRIFTQEDFNRAMAKTWKLILTQKPDILLKGK